MSEKSTLTQTIPLPAPCAPWCAKHDRGHRHGWDRVSARDADRTCRRHIGSTPTIDSGGLRYDVAVDRFESVDLGQEAECGPEKVALGDTWMTPDAARRLAAMLLRAADVIDGR